MNETKVNEEQVRTEHMKAVNSAAHWAYVAGVLGISFVLMLGLIAVLGN